MIFLIPIKQLFKVRAAVFGFCLFTGACCSLAFSHSAALSLAPQTVLNVVQITATHDEAANEHGFEVDKDVLPMGWNTFRFTNPTTSAHFYLIYKAPEAAIEGAEAADLPLEEYWRQNVQVPFQEVWDDYRNGAFEEVEGDPFADGFTPALFAAVLEGAPWFVEATVMGGPGLTSVGSSSQTTLNLPEGHYVAECYVKDENQVFHSYSGMVDAFEVTSEPSPMAEPEADLEVSISSTEGITAPDSRGIQPGMHTVQVNFEDQATYSHLVGHNVQLVRFTDDHDDKMLSDLQAWMDWTRLDGLVVRPPAGMRFMGGAMEMTAGSTAYLTVMLQPGQYAWIAEVPDAADKGMLKTFTVQEDSDDPR